MIIRKSILDVSKSILAEYHSTSELMQFLHFDSLRYYRSISNSHRVPVAFSGYGSNNCELDASMSLNISVHPQYLAIRFRNIMVVKFCIILDQ